MRINNNLMAMNTHRQLGINNNMTSKSLEKLSSGFRINRAGDDAAGLAISEKMRGQIRGLNMASKNAQDGISLIQTAEGALTESHAILQRMRELAVQSANDTNVKVDRGEIQKEVDQLAAELTRIAETTQFNTQDLLTGEFNAKFHIGANAGQNVDLAINNMSAKALEVGNVYVAEGDNLKEGETVVATWQDAVEETEEVEAKAAGYYKDGNLVLAADKKLDEGAKVVKGIDVSEQKTADVAITTINDAIQNVSAERSKLGAMQNRLEHTIKNLDTSAENLQAAESRIRDVDMAKEMMEFTKQNILQQAATAMLAQANQAPQTVLQLLR
ncbi:flagellin N-terminal helical domain-containing protein [Anaerosalibacter bizertensis]|uniref:flagellin N-terminal helical domain-containing protein n=1 Tax=Anaerosalibacter bizertensis TaxID=932217 RepID=UPI003512774F